jgi:hypothetical protein
MAISNLPPLPAASTPVINDDGTMNKVWLQFFAALLLALKRAP